MFCQSVPPRQAILFKEGYVMRKLIIAAAGLAAAMIPATSASAQTGYYGQGYGQYGQGYYGQNYNGRGNRAVQREIRECRRELRHAESRREYRRELAECQREIARAQRRGYNGYGYGNGYRDDDYGRRGGRRGW